LHRSILPANAKNRRCRAKNPRPLPGVSKRRRNAPTPLDAKARPPPVARKRHVAMLEFLKIRPKVQECRTCLTYAVISVHVYDIHYQEQISAFT
jgi:hypothetical protein